MALIIEPKEHQVIRCKNKRDYSELYIKMYKDERDGRWRFRFNGDDYEIDRMAIDEDGKQKALKNRKRNKNLYRLNQ